MAARADGLPRPAQAVIAGTTVLGTATAALLVVHFRSAGFGPALPLTLVGAFVFASWLWQMTMYVGTSSKANNLDEGLVVVAALVLPPVGALAAFAVAVAAAQAFRRRMLVKSAFNFFTELLSVSVAIALQHAIAPPTPRLTPLEVAATGIAALAYAAINSACVSTILVSLGGIRANEAFLDGLGISLRLLGASLVLGVVGGVAASRYTAALFVVGATFWVYHNLLSSQFHARHDRNRLHGLFGAALDVHRTMGDAAVTEALSTAASELLHSPEALVVDEPPGESVMAAEMSVHGETRWLAVAGRARTQPFDDADQALLDALAAVGSGALENSSLYEEVRVQQQRVLAITSSLTEGVCAFDERGRLVFLNPAAEILLGCREEDVLAAGGAPIEVLEHVSDLAQRALGTREPAQNERGAFARTDGEVFPVEYSCSLIRRDERVEGAVVAFRDISERIAFEEQLAHHAFHDALTGLANRRLFLDRLNHALSRTTRSDEMHAVLFVDVDRFKLANDSLGHQAGDEILVAIARRLEAVTRYGDTLARFGGDEFTLLLEDISGPEVALETATRMTEVIAKPIHLDSGRTVVVGASVGLALAVAGAVADDVLHDADVAMYQVKRSGGGGTAVFDERAMSPRSAEWIDLEVDLRRAIEEGTFEVHYQPCYSTSTGHISGAEALVRWRHPTRGLLEPGHFIGLAEETGIIMALGQHVLEVACCQARTWLDIVDEPFTISVNLSTRQFRANDLVDNVRATLESTGLPPACLCLEITESLAFDNVERSIATISELKDLGVRLAIDDFGTGYSSLTYLKRLPVDMVKLDQGFVMGLETNAVDSAIVAAVIDLAHKVGITAVAEGVETAGQLLQLKKMGCPIVQGYLLARPMPAESFTAQLLARRDGSKTRAASPKPA